MGLGPEGVDSMWIQTDAAKALLAWKASLEDEIVHRAGNLARANGESDTITLDHLRAVAVPALETVLKTIQSGGMCDGYNKAA